mmetsp:Transcript_15803/g.38226  ORF Transcript_15803/g.38226 Transcript_15803/m.38226 type:complete len:254 (-) Transcript_15803:236-997(-)
MQGVVVHLAEDCPGPLLHATLLVDHVTQLHDPVLRGSPLPVLLLIVRCAVVPGLHHLFLHAVVLVVHRLQQAGRNAPLSLFEDLVVPLEELVASQQHPKHIHTGPEALVVLLRVQVCELQGFEELIVQLLHVEADHHVGALLGAGRPGGLPGLILVVMLEDPPIRLQHGIRIVPHQPNGLQYQSERGLPLLHFHLVEGCGGRVELRSDQLRENRQHLVWSKIILRVGLGHLQHALEIVDDLVRVEPTAPAHLG